MKRIQLLAKSYYTRKEVQNAIYEFCKNRETIPRYLEGFGKRPDMLDYPSDIFNHAKKGATSFHCSEELWTNPLEISTNMTPEQLNQIKQGWDFLIDIDSKYLDYSKIAAQLIIKFLEHHGVKNIGIKYSGSKGFHLIIPWQAFPEEINEQKTKDMFPEWPRLIAQYIQDSIHDKLIERIFELSGKQNLQQEGKQVYETKCKICSQTALIHQVSKYKCRNCKTEMQKMQKQDSKSRKKLQCPSCKFDMDKIGEDEIYACEKCQATSQKTPEQFEKKPTAKALIDSVDIILVSPRHLFRCPYSLHEKTCLSSIVIDKNQIQDFQPLQADPLKIKIKNFYPKPEKDEAKELLLQALDWAKRKEIKPKTFKGNSIDIKGLKITEDMFPDCIQKILQGIKQDGRKRALSLLLSFFSSLEMPQEYIEEKIQEWNIKNYQPLKQGYVKSQIDWHSKNQRMPPNYDKPIYRELGILGETAGLKNPVNFTIREALKNKGRKRKNG